MRAELAEAGHLVREAESYDGVMGHAHAISIDGNGYRSGGRTLALMERLSGGRGIEFVAGR